MEVILIRARENILAVMVKACLELVKYAVLLVEVTELRTQVLVNREDVQRLRILPYMDDYLALFPSKEEAERGAIQMQTTLAWLGLEANPKKCVWTPPVPAGAEDPLTPAGRILLLLRESPGVGGGGPPKRLTHLTHTAHRPTSPLHTTILGPHVASVDCIPCCMLFCCLVFCHD